MLHFPPEAVVYYINVFINEIKSVLHTLKGYNFKLLYFGGFISQWRLSQYVGGPLIVFIHYIHIPTMDIIGIMDLIHYNGY